MDKKWIGLTTLILALPFSTYGYSASYEGDNDSELAPHYQYTDEGAVVHGSSDGDSEPVYTNVQQKKVYYKHKKTVRTQTKNIAYDPNFDYATRIPGQITPPGEKVIIVDPKLHVWGAYDADGKLVKAGLATAGGNWCPDIGRPCHTKSGSFRINSLGSAACKSSKYPLPRGGAPMPYCMYFNGSQGLHGSYQVIDANASHGCVRMRVSDAEWVRYNFATIGTRVIVKSY